MTDVVNAVASSVHFRRTVPSLRTVVLAIIGFVVGFAVVTMLERTASAQEAPPPPPDPAASPGFVTLDRGDASSRLGAEMSYLFFANSPAGATTTGLRFDVHAQYVDRSGFGGYAQLPISYLRERAAGMNNSNTVLADAEVGGLYVARIHPNVAAVLRLGVTLPTAPAGFDDIITNLVGELTRLTDLYDYIPKGTSVRVSVSPVLRQGGLFARVDAGIDTNLSTDSSITDVGTVERICAGVGYESNNVAFTAEIVNAHTGSSGGAWLDAGAVGMRADVGSVDLYGAVVFPLEHDTHQFMNAAVTLGVEGRRSAVPRAVKPRAFDPN